MKKFVCNLSINYFNAAYFYFSMTLIALSKLNKPTK